MSPSSMTRCAARRVSIRRFIACKVPGRISGGAFRMARDDVLVERNGPVTTVIINRPEARNACRVDTVKALHDAFMAFEADDAAKAAVLTGQNGTFCAGADLKELASGAALRFCWAGEDKGVTRRLLK